jgi:hypothetical protein
MSHKKLLDQNQLKTLFDEYHFYINKVKSNDSSPSLNNFYTHLRRKHNDFSKFSDMQIRNQIIASRRTHGNLLWPNLDDLQNYISPTTQTFLDKSVKAALLAVEIYNKPTIEYRTEGYIVMINIAWTSLFHAIFANDGIQYTYKIDGSMEKRYFELDKSLSKYSGQLKKEIEANLIFLKNLRDRIEHRIIPDLDDKVFGECQACLYNFEKILSDKFGSNYQINNSLAYSLQFSNKYSNQQILARKSYDIDNYHSIMKFIEEYRENLTPEIFQSVHYSFRVFMIPKVGNHIESSDLAVEFINYDPSKQQEYDSYEKLLFVIRDKRVPGEYLKAGEVAKQVFENLKDKKPANWKFSASSHHAKCTKYFKVRIGHYQGHPEITDGRYCIYDPTFNQHIYKKEWVEFLTKKLQEQELYNKIMKSK